MGGGGITFLGGWRECGPIENQDRGTSNLRWQQVWFVI